MSKTSPYSARFMVSLADNASLEVEEGESLEDLALIGLRAIMAGLADPNYAFPVTVDVRGIVQDVQLPHVKVMQAIREWFPEAAPAIVEP